MATKATLSSLPVELFHQISEQLSYSSHIALSFTCRELYMKLDTRRRLPTSSAQDKAYTMEDLLEIEEWSEHNPPHPEFNLCLVKFMACKICLKLRSRTKFCTMFKAYFYARRNALEGSEENVMKRRLNRFASRVRLPLGFMITWR